MLFSKFSYVLAFLAFGVSCGYSQLRPDQNQETNLPPVMDVSIKSEELVKADPVRRAYVTVGTNQFAFVVPDQFRMDASNPEVIQIMDAEASCFITFRVVPQSKSATKDSAAFRAAVLNRFPGARIEEEFPKKVNGRSGTAFDFDWTNANGALQSGRFIFVPTEAGTLEFSLLTRADVRSKGSYFFNSVLLSFCSNLDGPLTIVRLTDRM